MFYSHTNSKSVMRIVNKELVKIGKNCKIAKSTNGHLTLRKYTLFCLVKIIKSNMRT